MNTNASLFSPTARLDSTPARARLVAPVPLRSALLLGCVVAAGLAAALGGPADLLRADPALAHLLRAIALLKATIALAGIGVLLWRFGYPLGRGTALVYLIGTWALVGASALIWQLTWIAAAAGMFHGGVLTLLLAALRDDRAGAAAWFRVPGRRPSAAMDGRQPGRRS